MKKFFAIFFAFLMIAGTINAQDQEEPKKEIDVELRSGGVARAMAMGSNIFMNDPVNILSNPAYIDLYRNMIWGDVGTTAGAWADGSLQHFGGFNFGLNKQMVFGMLIGNQNYAQGGPLDVTRINGMITNTNGAAQTTVVLPNINNNLELMFAMKLGPKMSFGAGVSYASVKNNTTPATGNSIEYSGSQIGINAGLIMELAPTMSFDADLTLKMLSVSYTDGVAANETSVSGTEIDINGKLYMAMNKMVTLVPAVAFSTFSGTNEVGGTSVDLDSEMQLGVALGIIYVNKSLLLSGGVGFATISTTTAAVANVSPELVDGTTVFPSFNFGAEYYVTNWLKARAGFVSNTMQVTNETAATATDVNENVTTAFMGAGNDTPEVTLGVGFEFDQLHIDATINDDVLRQGFNIIGGGAQNTFARVSASLAF